MVNVGFFQMRNKCRDVATKVATDVLGNKEAVSEMFKTTLSKTTVFPCYKEVFNTFEKCNNDTVNCLM
ncbi:unnamed protein product [Gongylonema pulchrum]|uniref:24 kDa protein n=1 Tax=Gongylonema pulchrum TaxID=637853 RepID=A0A183DGH9_9BILA|nr:unnamed protein product [Gongylonema pulchrum]